MITSNDSFLVYKFSLFDPPQILSPTGRVKGAKTTETGLSVFKRCFNRSFYFKVEKLVDEEEFEISTSGTGYTFKAQCVNFWIVRALVRVA